VIHQPVRDLLTLMAHKSFPDDVAYEFTNPSASE
jgi:hypothetical protein